MEKYNDRFVDKGKYPQTISVNPTTAYKHIATIYMKGFLYNGCRFTLNLNGLFSYVREKQIHTALEVSIYPNNEATGYVVDCEYDERKSHAFSNDTSISFDSNSIKFVARKSFEADNDFVFNKVEVYVKNDQKTLIGYSVENIVTNGLADFEMSKDIFMKPTVPVSTIATDVNIYPIRKRTQAIRTINSNGDYTSSLKKVTDMVQKSVKYIGHIAAIGTMPKDKLLVYSEVPANATSEIRFLVPCTYVDYSYGYAVIGVTTSGAIYLRDLSKTTSPVVNIYFDQVQYYYN